MNKDFKSLTVKAVDWKDDCVVLLDQRKLPLSEEYIKCSSVDEVFDAIRAMVVRGAPAIGICAAYGVLLSAKSRNVEEREIFTKVYEDIEHLKTARPTAVNLMWALDVMKEEVRNQQLADEFVDIQKLLLKAQDIHSEDVANNYKMGELACAVFEQYTDKTFSVITHCNAGSLATGGYGTAIGVIRSAWRKGMLERVYADETRPWMQGSRLTAWELMKDDIPVTLNIDSAASWVMKNRSISWIIVGADRIAANGDVVNKIGTYALAIQAKFHGAKVMVVAPSSTIDMRTESGDLIDIEMRDVDELRQYKDIQISANNLDALNPVFDVTPASLVDYIVTEKGVIPCPNRVKMESIFKK